MDRFYETGMLEFVDVTFTWLMQPLRIYFFLSQAKLISFPAAETPAINLHFRSNRQEKLESRGE